eukprot:3261518-Amphidinium_carterae.1
MPVRGSLGVAALLQERALASFLRKGAASCRLGLKAVFGLRSEAGAMLNGKKGTIVQHLKDQGRFEVQGVLDPPAEDPTQVRGALHPPVEDPRTSYIESNSSKVETEADKLNSEKVRAAPDNPPVALGKNGEMVRSKRPFAWKAPSRTSQGQRSKGIEVVPAAVDAGTEEADA